MADAINAVSGNSAVAYLPIAVNTAPRTQTTNDSVFLSDSAQAKLLEQQGLTVSEISEKLGIPTSSVQFYLGITETVTSTTLTKAASASSF